MKKDEKILRYLSGLMNDEEAKEFIDQLKHSPELLEEYNEIKSYLENIVSVKNVTASDSKYFINLLPRAKQKLSSEEKSTFTKKIVYIVPVLTAILVLLFILPSSKSKLSTNYFTNQIVNNIDSEDILKNYPNFSNELEDYIIYETTKADTIEIPSDWQKGVEYYYLGNNLIRNGDDFNLLESLSEKELEVVYNDLTKINI
ncbi:hypothetical protein ABRY23_00625 [Melioribacteraceae bacterium 4301-Me]|uniref:hypothetical protein n=1 Tax=Pyranulibacter aquaticus TaxID=3163344 RepID=UPI00359A8821